MPKPSRPRVDPFLRALGVALVAARERAGLTQETLGYEAGLDRTYVSGVERGVRNSTIYSLRRLAEALRVPLSTVIADAERRV